MTRKALRHQNFLVRLALSPADTMDLKQWRCEDWELTGYNMVCLKGVTETSTGDTAEVVYVRDWAFMEVVKLL